MWIHKRGIFKWNDRIRVSCGIITSCPGHLLSSKWEIFILSKCLVYAFNILKFMLIDIWMFSFFRCDSVEKLKGRLHTLETELRDTTKFKDFYLFTFSYAKNPGQKGLGTFEPAFTCTSVCSKLFSIKCCCFISDLDMAITYWNIVLVGRFKFLNIWCQFLQVCDIFFFSPWALHLYCFNCWLLIIF